VHHDLWDYDGPQPVMLFGLHRGGRTIPALGHCNKSGEYYILDRRTGKPVFGVTERPVPAHPAWQHPWPSQPISSVQPLTPQAVGYAPPGVTPAAEFTPPTGHARLIQPGADGGCEWQPPAYSPRTGDVYYETRYLAALYTASRANPNGVTIEGETVESVPAHLRAGPAPASEILGSDAAEPVPGVRYHAIVGAVSTTTGRVVWKHALPVLAKSGLLVAGDLVFYGDNDGTFTAASARSGAPLWTFQATRYGTVGAPAAGPVAYAAGGREYVADPFGGNSAEAPFQESLLGDAVVAFALPGPHYHGPHISYADAAFGSGR
jgi:glucose dehydrogenase